jgi:LysR family hydrogen peroxide-inducible transcriptional activator
MENRRGQLVIRPFADPAPSRTVALVWRPASPLGAALREIAATIAATWKRRPVD